jgi:hypothetical protein
MDHLSERALIAAIRNRAFERTVYPAADRTSPPSILILLRVSGQNAFTANRTHPAADGMNAGQTVRAHGKA